MVCVAGVPEATGGVVAAGAAGAALMRGAAPLRRLVDAPDTDEVHAAANRTTAINIVERAATPRVELLPEVNTVWTSSRCRVFFRASRMTAILRPGAEESLKAPAGAMARPGRN